MKLSDYPKEFRDYVQWYPDMLKVEDRWGKIVPYVMYEQQTQLEFIVWEAMQLEEPCFLTVLKARKEGVSTWACASFFRHALEFENRHALIVSCDDTSTRAILQMTKRFHKYYPEKLETTKDSAAALALKETGSDFIIYTAGARERTGRGSTFQALHFTEFDFYSVADTFRSAMQSTPNEYPAVVVVESTAQGPEGPMEKHWRMAVDGTNGFTPVFFSCFDFAQYRRPLSFSDMLRYGPRPWREENELRLKVLRDTRGESESEEDDGIREDGTGLQSAGVEGGDGSPVQEPDHRGGGSQGETPPGESPEEPLGSGETANPWNQGRGFVQGNPGGWARAPRTPDGKVDQRYIRAMRDRVRRVRQAKSKKRELKSRAGFKQISAHHISDDTILREMKDSYTEYELGLIAEFGEERVPPEAINFIRWVKAVKCENDEPTRRREYPNRPEEAFEYSAETVLDPVVLSRWAGLAAKIVVKNIHFGMTEDKKGRLYVTPEETPIGRTMVFEEPVEGKKYCAGCDPAAGSKAKEGDWTVCSVLEVESGAQVAEFRAKMDQDQAIDQIEALCVWYNHAFLGVEANSYGIPYVRALEDRATVPMFEREVHDRREPNVTNKKAGWLTTANTRNILFTEMRHAVREDKCPIRSLVTLSECRTLVVARSEQSRLERIEARSGCHDDGVMAYGIALVMRNRCLDPILYVNMEDPIEEEDVNVTVRRMMMASGMKRENPWAPRIPLHVPVKHIGTNVSSKVDGRRSVL